MSTLFGYDTANSRNSTLGFRMTTRGHRPPTVNGLFRGTLKTIKKKRTNDFVHPHTNTHKDTVAN